MEHGDQIGIWDERKFQISGLGNPADDSDPK